MEAAASMSADYPSKYCKGNVKIFATSNLINNIAQQQIVQLFATSNLINNIAQQQIVQRITNKSIYVIEQQIRRNSKLVAWIHGEGIIGVERAVTSSTKLAICRIFYCIINIVF